jgi:hypothetical protein
VAYVAVSSGSLCNYGNRNLRWVRMQSCARSRSHSHNGIYPDDGGSRLRIRTGPIRPAFNPSRRYQPIVRVKSAHLSATARTKPWCVPHSQQIRLADCITKVQKGNPVDFLCRSQRCGPEQTSVQALQLFGFAIARRKRAPGVGRTRDHRDTPLGSRFKPDLKSGLAWKPPRFAAGVFFCGNRIDNRRRMLSTWNQGKR